MQPRKRCLSTTFSAGNRDRRTLTSCGGVHSGNTMAFQECMIAPVGALLMAHAVQRGSEVYQELKRVLTKIFGATGK